MKFVGICIIVLCGFMASYNIKKQYRKRIETIEEFIKNLEIMGTQIYFYKMPIYDIISDLYNSSDNLLKKFYENMINFLEKQTVEEAFKNTLENTDVGFEERDKKLICEFAKTLGTTDYESQLNNIKATKELLKSELSKAKNNRERNEKAKCTLVMSSFIILALILI